VPTRLAGCGLDGAGDGNDPALSAREVSAVDSPVMTCEFWLPA
jgi:hypothetical protein